MVCNDLSLASQTDVIDEHRVIQQKLGVLRAQDASMGAGKRRGAAAGSDGPLLRATHVSEPTWALVSL
jgi:hypothetical protein